MSGPNYCFDMGWLPIKLSGKRIHLYKAHKTPRFGGKTILVEDPWDYVDLWLHRQRSKKALFYWDQARSFYHASRMLSKNASPLTIYYSALNAVKTLLIAKNIPYSEGHGVGGSRIPSSPRSSLANEKVDLQGAGVIPEFCKYLGESVGNGDYTLKDIFYNLPFIHRAYTVTFSSEPELFIPITDPLFVRQETTNKACFRCQIRDQKYQNANTLSTLNGFEIHQESGAENLYLIRWRKRFDWVRGGAKATNLEKLRNYHLEVRKRTMYIKGISRLWYLKRSTGTRLIDRSSMTLSLMAMHRLSELSRYTPDQLAKHFECQHNYLLSQFLIRSLDQFIDEISAELTGDDFMLPGYVGN